MKGDYNVNNANKVTFKYNQLDSNSPVGQSTSSSLGAARTSGTHFLSYANSNYAILENLKSGVGEWNSVFGNMTNNLMLGYTHQDESRGPQGQTPLFPFVVIGDGDGTAYTSFGNEPFTPYNLLRYNTFQVQDSVTKFAKNHSITFGGNLEKFHSDNSFYFGIQSAYSYNSLADFYADANGYLANPNRTVSPVTLGIFQVKYLLQPGQTVPPLQPLDVIYAGGYIQDEWRPKTNLTVTAGIRIDVPKFGNTAFDNPVADNLTFRDQDGSAVKYNTGALPDATPYWSPRVGINWDVNGNQATQVRGGSGLFSGKPPYVWISNQIGNTGVLYGFVQNNEHDGEPVQPEPGQVQAGGDRRYGGQLRAGRDRQGLPLPADVAHQHRRRPPPAVGPGRFARLHLQPGHQRAGLRRTPTCRRRQALTRAWTTAIAGRRRQPEPRCCRASPSRCRRA